VEPTLQLDEVTPEILRGGQPNAKGFAELKARGVTTILNLRYEDDSERNLVTGMGFRYAYIPMPDTNPPTMNQVQQLHQLLVHPGTGKLFLHCSAGKFRTGTMVGIIRLDAGMSFDAMLAEAKSLGFDPEFLDAPYQLKFLEMYAQRGIWACSAFGY
jgi:protein tyrosine phosphatase (PTP) superfamily phosphohydrolase (DUF442 family)